ncbi:MAG TPA: hypothetical protein VHQ24_05635 [Lachnospiraceae bacterium]|nr:hypothetical protein [Lachnospiraceae bacterium]
MKGYDMSKNEQIIKEIKQRSESLLAYYHIFSYAATTRKEYRQDKYDDYNFLLLIFTVIACMEDLQIEYDAFTKQEVIDMVSGVMKEMGIKDIKPSELVNEIITKCLQNNGYQIKKDTFLENCAPAVTLLKSEQRSIAGNYISRYTLETSTLNILYATKEYYDVMDQSKIIIRKQMQRGNVSEAIREVRALRSVVSSRIANMDRLIASIQNNLQTIDISQVKSQMQESLDGIKTHQKETKLIIASIENDEEEVQVLTLADKLKIKEYLVEVSKLEMELLLTIQNCMSILNESLMNFEFITLDTSLNLYQDVLLPIERDGKGRIPLDTLFAPLFHINRQKMFDAMSPFYPQQVKGVMETEDTIIEDISIDEEIQASTEDVRVRELIDGCEGLLYCLLEDLTLTDSLTLEKFVDIHAQARESLTVLRLFACYMFSEKCSVISGDYQPASKEMLESNTFHAQEVFAAFEKRAFFSGKEIRTEALEDMLAFEDGKVRIRIPNLQFSVTPVR